MRVADTRLFDKLLEKDGAVAVVGHDTLNIVADQRMLSRILSIFNMLINPFSLSDWKHMDGALMNILTLSFSRGQAFDALKVSTFYIRSWTADVQSHGCSAFIFTYTFHSTWDKRSQAPRKPLQLQDTSLHRVYNQGGVSNLPLFVQKSLLVKTPNSFTDGFLHKKMSFF